jgi:SAM-dependent methyltransferase
MFPEIYVFESAAWFNEEAIILVKNEVARITKSFLRNTIPLTVRKLIAKFISNQSWISSDYRAGWSMELVRDIALNDANQYHKFLWSNHIGYADTYEINQRFGESNLNDSRKLLFSDMQQTLSDLEINYHQDIKSVLDVGSSLGYHLNYLEEKIFTNAETLEGIDIDCYAINKGASHLKNIGSKVQLSCLDMENLESYLSGKSYDLILCAGTLIYLKEDQATKLVSLLLKHTNKMLVFSGIASPDEDNTNLEQSAVRTRDGSFIHNIDKMVAQAEGRIVFRRYEGKKMYGGNTIYFVFATP